MEVARRTTIDVMKFLHVKNITPAAAPPPANLIASFQSLRHRRQLFSRMSAPTSETALEKYRYEILFGAWLAVTGATFLRIKRQPYSTRLKIEQYESIFKGTSLGAVLIGIGIAPVRSTARRFGPN
jgi:hypothetical protein